MKENKSFIQALKTASQAANAKNSLPILDYFLVDGNTITITNLEVTMKVQFEGEPFNACLPIETVLKGLKHVNGDFDISINGRMAKFKAGDFEFDVPVEDVDNFVKIEEVNAEYINVFDVCIGEAMKFVEMTEFTRLRPVLNGVAFIPSNGLLNIVSTSGNILYEQRTEIEFNKSFVLPIKACGIIKDISEFEIASDGKKASIKYDGVEVISTLSEGQFPNYKSVIPDNKSQLDVDWMQLSSSIERVSEFSDSTTRLVRLNVKQNSVDIIGQDINFATSSRETVKLNSPATPIEIGFKASYIIQALRVGRGNINYTEPNRAITVKDENKTVLVMPMSLQ